MTDLAEAPAHLTANEIVAKNVRGELGLAGISQAALAAELGETEMWLSRRLNNVVQFSANDVQAIANVFGIPPGDLFIEKVRRAGVGAIGRRHLVLLDDGMEWARRGSNPRPADYTGVGSDDNRMTFAEIVDIDEAFNRRALRDRELVNA